jgi:hypothetical protein
MTPWRDQIRFGKTISGCAVGRKGSNGIIGNAGRAFVIGGANRNNKGIIGWRVEGGGAIIAGITPISGKGERI